MNPSRSISVFDNPIGSVPHRQEAATGIVGVEQTVKHLVLEAFGRGIDIRTVGG